MVQLLKKYDTGSSISTDCGQPVEKEHDFDEFIDSLTTMFIELTEHHYTAKNKVNFSNREKLPSSLMNVFLCWILLRIYS